MTTKHAITESSVRIQLFDDAIFSHINQKVQLTNVEGRGCAVITDKLIRSEIFDNLNAHGISRANDRFAQCLERHMLAEGVSLLKLRNLIDVAE